MKTSLSCLIAIFCTCNFSFSQPSLASGDMDELVIIINGQEESYTVVRDALKKLQWYYIPNTPRLNEVKINNQANPEISLIRYQFADEASPGGMKEGGIVQFSVTLSAAPQALQFLKNSLEARLAARMGGVTPIINLAPLPLKSANATIYSPTDNTIISNVFGTGSFPIFASQKAPFVLYLTKQGSDINDALIGNSVTSNTGIPLIIEFTFHGLTPAASLHIKANYRKIFNHYSEDKVFAARASYYGLFGASSSMRWTTIKEKLQVNGALTVEKITNTEISEENMDAVMQGIMKRINDNIMQVMSPPPVIPPATAATPKLSGRFGSAGYNASFKTVEMISELDDEFIWNERKIIERKTVAGGFIGIGTYPEDIRKRVVQFVPGFSWQSAHFILPPITNLPDLTQVTIKTDMMKSNAVVSTKTAIWTPIENWKSVPGNKPISTLDFAITTYINNDILASDLSFKTTTTLLQGDRQIVLVSDQPLVNGGIPVTPPEIGITSIILDPSDLAFKNVDPTAKLLRVQISMQLGADNYIKTIQPKLVGGNYTFPLPITWTVKKIDVQNNPVKIKLKFEYSGGNESKTLIIGDLKQTEPALNFLLRDPTKIDG